MTWTVDKYKGIHIEQAKDDCRVFISTPSGRRFFSGKAKVQSAKAHINRQIANGEEYFVEAAKNEELPPLTKVRLIDGSKGTITGFLNKTPGGSKVYEVCVQRKGCGIGLYNISELDFTVIRRGRYVD